MAATGWLHTEMVCPPADGYPSKFSVGSRAFLVAAAKIWKTLPGSLVYGILVLSAPSEDISVPAIFLVALQWT